MSGARGLPAGLVPAAQGQAPVTPRHAATVVLLRDGADGVQAWLLRRVSSMAFAPRMHVFPGGSVDPRDADAQPAWVGPDPSEWTGPLTADAGLARALVCAAVRETFEESGVLLASAADSTDVVDAAGWDADRQGLEARRESLAGLLERRGLALRADLLRPWAHWMTPEAEPRRYDTRFFVAALPPGQSPRHEGGEADATLWLSPAEALRRHAKGQLDMLPPTAFTLAELSAFDSVEAVLTAAAARDIRRVLPKIVIDGEQVGILLPGDEGYDHEEYDG